MALIAARTALTALIRSVAIRSAVVSLIGRHAVAVCKSEATTATGASVDQASSRKGECSGH